LEAITPALVDGTRHFIGGEIPKNGMFEADKTLRASLLNQAEDDDHENLNPGDID
jgi:hypothetical protein